MATRTAKAEWKGDLRQGRGNIALGSGAFSGQYSFGSRFEEAGGTNPEELIAAAHAGCFSMALAAELGKAGHKPERIATTASVTIEPGGGGFAITSSALETVAHVPEIGEAEFQKIATGAKEGCPVSKALAAIRISLDARLENAG